MSVLMIKYISLNKTCLRKTSGNTFTKSYRAKKVKQFV